MTDWITLPPPPLLVARGSPRLVESAKIRELTRYVASAGANLVEADVSGAADTTAVIGALKTVLPFPDWCGSSWDSIDDAFEELRSLWTFPLVVIIVRYDVLLEKHQHLALATVVGIHELESAFSAAGEQFAPVFEGRSWT